MFMTAMLVLGMATQSISAYGEDLATELTATQTTSLAAAQGYVPIMPLNDVTWDSSTTFPQAINTSTNITVVGNVIVTGQIVIAGAGTNVTITSGTLTRAAADAAINLQIGATLTLNNIVIDGNNVPSGNALISVQANGMLMMSNTTLQNSAAGGVTVDNNASLTMNGSTISNNTGAGVHLGANSSTLTMNGGIISGNEGGGVFTNAVPTITLGGNAVITNNRVFGNLNNVNLPHASTFITFGTGANVPTAGMSVGVTKTAGNGVFVQNGATPAHIPFFTADATSNSIVHNNGALRSMATVNMRTISFDANNASGTMYPDTVAQGENYSIKPNAFAHTGWLFTGWNTAANGTGTAHNEGATINNIQADTTLYAQWEQSITTLAIPGVTAPTLGGSPVTTTTATPQHTGTVTWTPSHNPFQADTTYTATITLTPATGFTLQGTAANSFTVAGATSVTHDANSGIIMAVFPAIGSPAPINSVAITNVQTPITGATRITTATATGNFTTSAVTWSPSVGTAFAASTQYTASVELTADAGHTFPAGFTATINGINAVVSGSLPGNTVTVSLQFPQTAAAAVAPTITSGNPPSGVVDTVYSFTFTATGTTPITWTHTLGTLPPELTLTTNGLLSGTPNTTGNFTFTVQASNVAGDVSQTYTIAIGTASTAPSEPQNLVAVAGNGQVVLSWDAPVSNGGSAILRYEIQVNGGAWVDVLLATSHTVTGLTNGTAATFNVRAININDASTNATTTATPTAVAPTNHTVTFNLNGGNINGNTSNVVMPSVSNNTAVTPPNPTRHNHTLSSWSSCVAGMTPANITGNVTFTAQWTHTPPTDTSNGGNYRPSPNHAWLSTSRATFDRANPQDITITLNSGGFSFRNIRFGTGNNAVNLVSGRDFTVTGNRYTINVSFLSTLELGERRLLFDMSGGSNPSILITVIGSTPAVVPTPDPTPAPVDDVPPTLDIIPGTGRPAVQPMPLHFADVHPTDWFYPFVRVVWEQQLFNGVNPTTFDPQGSMTRAMFVQVLASLEGVDLAEYQATYVNAANPTFADTHPAAWYFGAVEWAVEQGLVNGIGNGNFAPDRPFTRQEMAVMLNRYIVSRGIALPNGATGIFTDQTNISEWALEGVLAIQAARIITGFSDGSFAPQGTATRAEVATIFARFLEVADMPRRVHKS